MDRPRHRTPTHHRHPTTRLDMAQPHPTTKRIPTLANDPTRLDRQLADGTKARTRSLSALGTSQTTRRIPQARCEQGDGSNSNRNRSNLPSNSDPFPSSTHNDHALGLSWWEHELSGDVSRIVLLPRALSRSCTSTVNLSEVSDRLVPKVEFTGEVGGGWKTWSSGPKSVGP